MTKTKTKSNIKIDTPQDKINTKINTHNEIRDLYIVKHEENIGCFPLICLGYIFSIILLSFCIPNWHYEGNNGLCVLQSQKITDYIKYSNNCDNCYHDENLYDECSQESWKKEGKCLSIQKCQGIYQNESCPCVDHRRKYVCTVEPQTYYKDITTIVDVYPIDSDKYLTTLTISKRCEIDDETCIEIPEKEWYCYYDDDFYGKEKVIRDSPYHSLKFSGSFIFIVTLCCHFIYYINCKLIQYGYKAK